MLYLPPDFVESFIFNANKISEMNFVNYCSVFIHGGSKSITAIELWIVGRGLICLGGGGKEGRGLTILVHIFITFFKRKTSFKKSRTKQKSVIN